VVSKVKASSRDDVVLSGWGGERKLSCVYHKAVFRREMALESERRDRALVPVIKGCFLVRVCSEAGPCMGTLPAQPLQPWDEDVLPSSCSALCACFIVKCGCSEHRGLTCLPLTCIALWTPAANPEVAGWLEGLEKKFMSDWHSDSAVLEPSWIPQTLVKYLSS